MASAANRLRAFAFPHVKLQRCYIGGIPSERIRALGVGESVWSVFTPLLAQHKAVNLGQGFPDFAAPSGLKEAAIDAIDGNINQYARSAGHPRLTRALANAYSPLFDRQLDPDRNVLVGCGATESMFAALQGLVSPGDEVIVMEPFYDSYPSQIIMAGGVPRFVPLQRREGAAADSGAFALDFAELERSFSAKTRAIILNTPHNPVGKLFSRGELQTIADLAIKHDVVVLSDEVYEWITYDGAKHERIATLPGMWERTLTFGSAGKTFSATGWKVGWALGPEDLVQAAFFAHQWITFCVSTPLQEAVAVAFENAERDGYFPWLVDMFSGKRDRLATALREVGLTPMMPHGSYFMLADTSALRNIAREARSRDEENDPDDVAVCKWLVREAGVGVIPPSAFYSPKHKHLPANFVRFCFSKRDDILDEAVARLRSRLS